MEKPEVGVFVRVSVAVMETPWPQQLGEERVYFLYTFTSLFIIKSSQDRNPAAGADAEAIAEYCSRTCSTCVFHRAQDHQRRAGPIHNGLGSPMEITNGESALQMYLQPDLSFPPLQCL